MDGDTTRATPWGLSSRCFFLGGGKGRVVNLRLDRPGVDRIPPAPRVGVASGVATDIASHRDVLVTDGVLYAIVLQYIFIYLDRLDCTREYIIRHACMLRPRWMSMNHDSSRQWAGCVGAPRVCVCARVCFRRANARPQSSTVDRRFSRARVRRRVLNMRDEETSER